MRTSGLDFERIADSNHRIVAVGGEVDLYSAPALEQVLGEEADSGAPIVVDLTGCSYFDSSGLNVLLRLRKALGYAYPIVAPRAAAARRLFELAHVEELFALYETRGDAVAAEVEQTSSD